MPTRQRLTTKPAPAKPAPAKPAPRAMPSGQADRPPAVAVIVSRYNATVTDLLLAGALAAYAEAYAGSDHLACDVYHAPGSFELVALTDAALATGRYDGTVALGCIIKGETDHDQYLAHAVTQGLVAAAIKHTRPTTNGVLTVLSQSQALARAGVAPQRPRTDRPKHLGNQLHIGNKGHEAMTALLDTLQQTRAMMNAINQPASALSTHARPPLARPPLARPDKLARSGARA